MRRRGRGRYRAGPGRAAGREQTWVGPRPTRSRRQVRSVGLLLRVAYRAPPRTGCLRGRRRRRIGKSVTPFHRQMQELWERQSPEPSILLESWRYDLREGVNFSFVGRRS